MTELTIGAPERATNEESRQITLDYIRLGTRLDVTAVKRTIVKTFINEHGVSETQTTVEQDVVRHYEIEELRRGDEFRDRRGYVLMTEAIAHGIAISHGAMLSISEHFCSSEPVNMITFPENIGLRDDDVYVMAKPYDAALKGLDFFVCEYGSGVYYDLRCERPTHLPMPIGVGPLIGMDHHNFDIDKAETILRANPCVVDLRRERSGFFGGHKKENQSDDVLFFHVILDKDAYNEVAQRACSYEARGLSFTANALAMFEQDTLGLRAGGAAKIDSVLDYRFHGRTEDDLRVIKSMAA